MQFKDIVMERYAVKQFTGEKIPQEKIDELFEIIRYAPSSFNIQPWKIKVIEDDTTKEKLQEASWNQPQVTSSSHFLVFCANTDLMKLVDQLQQLMLEGGVPEEKVEIFIGMTRPFLQALSKEEQLSWAQRQVYIALGNAMNAAKALGFDSCPMEGIEPANYAKVLNIQEPLVVTVALGLGIAADTQRAKLRFKKEEIFF